MRRIRVVVPWRDGLHLRPAAKLVQVAQQFRAKISLESSGKVAELRSILSILTLCASMGTGLNILADGDDEQEAVAAVEEIFKAEDSEQISGVTEDGSDLAS